MTEKSPLGIIVAGACGRMGRTITDILMTEAPDFALAGALDMADRLGEIENLPCPVSNRLEDLLSAAPEAIVVDFTAPAASLAAAEIVAARGRAMVMGSTGFNEEQKKRLEDLARETPLFWSANMSVGVNVLLELLPRLSVALGPAYDVEMMEIHHRRKKDSPSGTALMLGEAVARAKNWSLPETRVSCRDGLVGERKDREIGIQALRGGDVVGIHECFFLGPGEIIKISHQAESRETFARGALRAAAWLSGQKKGRLYSMRDVLESVATK